MPAGKAYLKIPTALVSSPTYSKGISYIFADDEATGVTEITAPQNEDELWHTLSGVRVNKPSKGVYIHKGRKVVVK